MSKNLTIKSNNSLSQVREEFQFFKNKQDARTKKRTTATSKVTAPTIAHEILLCSKTIGARSLMTYEVTAKKAKLVKATPIKYQAGRTVKETQDCLTINRKTSINSDYEGCPYCGQGTVVHCHCGVISCGSNWNSRHTCPGCGNHSRTVTRRQTTTLTSASPTRNTLNKSSSSTTQMLSRDSRLSLTHKK